MLINMRLIKLFMALNGNEINGTSAGTIVNGKRVFIRTMIF